MPAPRFTSIAISGASKRRSASSSSKATVSPASADGHAHDVDGHVLLAKCRTRTPRSCGDAAPVCVVAVNGRLHERRVRDGARSRVGVGVGGGARDMHGHKPRGALAVGGHHAREVRAHFLISGGERTVGGSSRLDGSRTWSRSPARERDAGVVSRGVRVDGRSC